MGDVAELEAESLAASYTFRELLAMARDEGVCMHHAKDKLALARSIAEAWAGGEDADGRLA